MAGTQAAGVGWLRCPDQARPLAQGPVCMAGQGSLPTGIEGPLQRLPEQAAKRISLPRIQQLEGMGTAQP